MNRKRKQLSMLLVLCMVFAMLPINTVTVSAAVGIAKIDKDYYDTLQSAVDAAATSESEIIIELLDRTSESVSTVSGSSITIDLNGYRWDSNGNPAIIYNGSGKLTIMDSSTDANGIITSYSASTIRNTSTGSVEVSGGMVQAIDENGIAINNEADGSVNMTGGEVQATGKNGIPINNEANGAVNVTGGIVYYDLWVGDTQVTNANMNDMLGDAGSGATVTYTPAYKSSQTGYVPQTLTLNNACITTALDKGWTDSKYGIFTNSALNLLLTADSDNRVESTVYADSLTIAGTGSLTVNGSEAITSYGIKCENETTISGGAKVTAIGGRSQSSYDDSYGIKSGDLTISGDSTVVNATGGEAVFSTGICVNNTLSISGGTVIATSIEENRWSYTNTGIDSKTITISGGTVIATGVDCSYSYGFRGTKINISGGTVKAKSQGSSTSQYSASQAIAITDLDLTNYISYQWRMNESSEFTPMSITPYTHNTSNTYVEIEPEVRTAMPTTAVNTIIKTDAAQQRVSFPLTNSGSYGVSSIWIVYSDPTEATLAPGVRASINGDMLYLEHDSDVPATTYYISVIDSDKTESERLALTVDAYDAPITFIPVTDINMNNSASVQAGTNLTLTGTVTPGDATNRSITWSVENANSTGANITGSTFRATSAGIATVKATVANGLSTSSDYTKTFIITVTAAPTSNSDTTPSFTPSNTEKSEGTVEKDKQQEDGAPTVNVNNSGDELKTSVLTPEEQERVARGDNAKIILKVTDISASVSKEEKKLIQDKLAAENGVSENTAVDKSVLYVDLSLYKQVGSQEQTRVTETKGKISISLEVPKELWNTDVTKSREFYVLRIHDREVTRIEGTYDADKHLFTFETDRFSTYALTYQDTRQIQTYQDFHHMQLTAKADKTSQTLSYKKAANVDGYLIYGGRCGGEMTKLADLSANITSYTVKNLKKVANYKYQVKAYRIIDGEQVVVMTSKVIHSITESKTYANPTKVTTDTASVKLKVGKSKTVTSLVVLPKGKKLKEHTATIRYESSNKEVATVNSKGKIIAKAKGTCYVYAYAQNGVYKRIKVTVE